MGELKRGMEKKQKGSQCRLSVEAPASRIVFLVFLMGRTPLFPAGPMNMLCPCLNTEVQPNCLEMHMIVAVLP